MRLLSPRRIGIGLDADDPDHAFGVTVAPGDPRFWSVVEPGVRPLVRALLAKGWRTYHSCDGHKPWERRVVGIAFLHAGERQRFGAAVAALRLPLVAMVDDDPCQPAGQSALAPPQQPAGDWSTLFGLQADWRFAELEVWRPLHPVAALLRPWLVAHATRRLTRAIETPAFPDARR